MVDYSKFDKIDVSDDEEERATEKVPQQAQEMPMKQDFGGPKVIKRAEEGSEKGRIKFVHGGQTVYEWEQSLEEVNIFVRPPPGITSPMVECKIEHKHLTLGIKGNPPFLNEDCGGPVKVKESFWMMDDNGEININLQKMEKGALWDSALRGHGGSAVDPVTKEDMKKRIMLERFQEENPGFDFSGAEFNGAVPDAQSFMGGVKYT